MSLDSSWLLKRKKEIKKRWADRRSNVSASCSGRACILLVCMQQWVLVPCEELLIIRTLLASMSAMNRFENLSMAILTGAMKEESVPRPSETPETPLPANVWTTPANSKKMQMENSKVTIVGIGMGRKLTDHTCARARTWQCTYYSKSIDITLRDLN